MINMMKLAYVPGCCEWVHSPGDAVSVLAVYGYFQYLINRQLLRGLLLFSLSLLDLIQRVEQSTCMMGMESMYLSIKLKLCTQNQFNLFR